MNTDDLEIIKCVVVGDGAVGKTALLISYTTNKFPEDYIPTVFENYASIVNVGDKKVKLDLWDTAGQEEYERIRSLSYPKTSIFFICFSVVEPDSLQNAKSKWVTEVRHFNSTTPFLLIGLKTDLRTNEEVLDNLKKKNKKVVSRNEGVKAAKEIKAVKYMECSSLTQDGLTEIFSQAVITGLHGPEEPKKKSCFIL